MVVARHAVADGASLLLTVPPEDRPPVTVDRLGMAPGPREPLSPRHGCSSRCCRAIAAARSSRSTGWWRSTASSSGWAAWSPTASWRPISPTSGSRSPARSWRCSPRSRCRGSSRRSARHGRSGAPEEAVEIVEDETIKGRVLRAVLWGAGVRRALRAGAPPRRHCCSSRPARSTAAGCRRCAARRRR